MEPGTSILGTRVRRIEDPALLLGEGRYVADLDEPELRGALHLAFVRSYLAHGELLDIDTSTAEAMPGVVAVFTAADLAFPECPLLPAHPGGAGAPPAMARPYLATERVRFVGEPVAVVVANTAAEAADAIEGVLVELDALAAVVGIESGFDDETLLFPDAGTNRNSLMDDGWEHSDDHDGSEGFFDGCEVVVHLRCANPRMAGVSIEARASAAAFVDGRLTQWISSQNAHGARNSIAGALGLDESEVRVVVPDVGGAFGPKINPSPEDVLVGWVARRLGRPAIWVETRSENLTAQSQGRGHLHEATIGGTRDGRVLAYELDIRADSGAYPRLGSFLPFFTRLMTPGPYAIERVRSRAECTVTNTTPTEAFRGAGRPEATATLERAMDMFAAELGMDPAEVRRINLLEPFDSPHRTSSGAEYDSGDYRMALDAALGEAGYVELRAEQLRRRAAQHRLALGVGVSTYVEVTGASMTSEFASVEVHLAPDHPAGVVVSVMTGVSPHGQGLHTALAMITSEVLGVPVGSVVVAHGDTDAVPHGNGTMGSRSLQIGGTAVSAAAEQILDTARELAAHELEAAATDIVADPGRAALHVRGTPTRSVPWSRVAVLAQESAREESAHQGSAGSATPAPALSVSGSFGASGNTYPNGCHVAVVEVDLDTGLVNLLRLVAADDAGTIVNPMLAEGQRHGGIAQGVSQALFEAVRWDDDGNPLTAVLADYGIPSAADLPRWELVDVATPSPMNPLGAKGIGESGTIGATPAVQSAVIDALAHLGVRHLDMPLTPERVWRAANGLGP